MATLYARLRSIRHYPASRVTPTTARSTIGEINMSKNKGLTSPGGVSRIRTGDPLYAKQMLYH